LSVVVDASVLVAALVDSGASGQWAEEILASATLVAPELAKVEAANVLRRLERDRRISTPEANGAYDDLLQLGVEWFSFEPFAARIWQLRNNVSCYDAWYVALAEALDLPLATMDARLARASGPACRFLTFPG
jgi:predicted nucleic acid-binding protein